MSILRTAAHMRHAAFSAACWWWCPPMHLASRVAHAAFVDGVYDCLEMRGRGRRGGMLPLADR